jgi:hypothetical protein
MAAMMWVATRPAAMGPYRASRMEALFGWTATIVMAMAVAAMGVLALV